MEIKILGTVSPHCKGTKNCPGYLITDGLKKILLDCGNGISRNLNLPEDLENLTIIISHLHKDHYGELLSLGYSTYVFHNVGYLNKKVRVYIPEADYRVIAKSQIDNSKQSPGIVTKALSDYIFLQDFGDEHFFEFITYNQKTKLKIGNLQIDFVENPHPITTFSTRIKDNNETLIYSADTGYKENTLVDFAKEADILLCESTFLEGQVRKTDNHLYASEAAQIAKDANVKKLILTHFFPEIDKSIYVAEAKKIFENTEAAEEGKVLKIGGIK